MEAAAAGLRGSPPAMATGSARRDDDSLRTVLEGIAVSLHELQEMAKEERHANRLFMNRILAKLEALPGQNAPVEETAAGIPAEARPRAPVPGQMQDPDPQDQTEASMVEYLTQGTTRQTPAAPRRALHLVQGLGRVSTSEERAMGALYRQGTIQGEPIGV